MVKDRQVQRLWKLLGVRKSLVVASVSSNMDRKTGRKYRELGKLPSELAAAHTWRTRPDPFAEVWAEVSQQLEAAPGLQAKTLLEWLQRKYPGRFEEGQLRTLQRRVKAWRATHGEPKEVFFSQVHHPGRLGASDFTHMTSLGVTIAGVSFEHLVYHFVLTYSNWETITICFSERFEALSEGLQNALWALGGVPARHRSDRMSAAVKNPSQRQEFTQRYDALLAHYGLAGETINARQANENGDVEQSHRRFKDAVDQALLLRGSRDFASRDEYEAFLRDVLDGRNAGRQKRFAEEPKRLRPLPPRRQESCQRLRVRVDAGSLIHVKRNVYSVHSRLIGEWVDVRIYADHLEVWYGQKQVEKLPRLRGRNKHRINYRHVIDWLVRKPGAFEDYRYREDLFPTSRFRMAYDALSESMAGRASREANRVERLLRQSRLPLEKTLESFDLKRLPAKVGRQVRTLLDGSFVDRQENLLVFGKSGSGKTHLLCAVAQELIRAGRKVCFRTCSLLVQELLIAKRDLKLSKLLKKLSGFEALIIDDIGYVQQSREEMEVLFTLLAERYERGSVLLTSNLPFSKWESIFKDPMTTAAAIDRLVHHSVILELNISSYRLEQAKVAQRKN